MTTTEENRPSDNDATVVYYPIGDPAPAYEASRERLAAQHQAIEHLDGKLLNGTAFAGALVALLWGFIGARADVEPVEWWMVGASSFLGFIAAILGVSGTWPRNITIFPADRAWFVDKASEAIWFAHPKDLQPRWDRDTLLWAVTERVFDAGDEAGETVSRKSFLLKVLLVVLSLQLATAVFALVLVAGNGQHTSSSGHVPLPTVRY